MFGWCSDVLENSLDKDISDASRKTYGCSFRLSSKTDMAKASTGVAIYIGELLYISASRSMAF